MRRAVMAIILLAALITAVNAAEYTAPTVSGDALELIPQETESFGSDLWKVICSAAEKLQPQIYTCAKSCISVFAAAMLISLLNTAPGRSADMCQFAGVIAVAAVLLQSANALITLAADTVSELSEYGKLLLPVMTAALAGQGAVTSSAALYTATALFSAVLSGAISNLLVPMVYVYIALAIASAAMGQRSLEALRDAVKWLVSWCLKTILYVFTGYMSITGVISGTTDAAALKATKLTISSVVPVVGGILSDASEAVVVSAGLVKNSVGIYGFLAVVAIWIGPFLRIGIQYLLLKLTAAVCAMFDVKPVSAVIDAFSAAMGLLLGMTGAGCVLLLVSTVCFMKGAS